MIHRRARGIVPVLLVGLALAVGAQAQPVQDEKVGVAFTGEVTSVDAKAMTLRVKGANGEEGTFHVDAEATTIMSGSDEVELSALHEGEWIAVTANTRDGRQLASYIEVVQDPTGASEASPAQPTPAGATIEVGHNRLSPAMVEIGAGQTVTFHNVDKMPGGHTVVAVDGAFSSPALDEDQSWSHSFDAPGEYRVRIKEHPAAEATIVVQ